MEEKTSPIADELRDIAEEHIAEVEASEARLREALRLIAMADLERAGQTTGVKGATMTTALEMRSIARRTLGEKS